MAHLNQARYHSQLACPDLCDPHTRVCSSFDRYVEDRLPHRQSIHTYLCTTLTIDSNSARCIHDCTLHLLSPVTMPWPDLRLEALCYVSAIICIVSLAL